MMKKSSQHYFLLQTCLLVCLLAASTFTIGNENRNRRLLRITAGSVSTEYNAESCKNTTHLSIQQIKSMEFLGCINLYKEKDCSGRFIRWEPYLIPNLEVPTMHFWKFHDDQANFRLVVGSIGPCLDPCDARNWDNLSLTEPTEIVITDDENFRGGRNILSVGGSECVSVPLEKGVKSVKILKAKDACFELHSTVDCSGGNYTIIRPDYPMLNNLFYDGMHLAAEVAPYQVRAISLCGKFCKEMKLTGSGKIETTSNDTHIGVRNDLDVTIISEFHNADAVSFNISGCVNLPKSTVRYTNYITSNSRKCLNLYPKADCGGRVTRWQPLFSSLRHPVSTHWDGNVLRENPFQLMSVGSCQDRCDPSYWEGPDGTREVEVTLFDTEEFKGNETVLVVKPEECTLIPSQFRVKSIKIQGNDSCIELHAAPHCGDLQYGILRPGYPHLKDLWYYGVNDESTFSMTNARAVSLCGSFCQRRSQMKLVNDPPKESPGDGYVTIFDYMGYYGSPTHYDLSKGCRNFKDSRLTPFRSLWTYGQCVVTFEGTDCKPESVFSATLQTSDKPAEYYIEKISASTFPFMVKSMRLCNDVELADGRKLSDFFAGHFYIMIPMLILICIALVSTCGAYIGSKYRNFSLKEDSKRFAVSYNSRNSEGVNRLL